MASTGRLGCGAVLAGPTACSMEGGDGRGDKRGAVPGGEGIGRVWLEQQTPHTQCLGVGCLVGKGSGCLVEAQQLLLPP